MAIPAYSKKYAKRQILTLNVSAIVIIKFIKFDEHILRKCVWSLINLCIKYGYLAKAYLI